MTYYYNEQDREELLERLSKMQLPRAKWHLRRSDRQAEIEVFRNVQQTGEWLTRFRLHGRGTLVTLIEKLNNTSDDPSVREKAEFEMVRVIVEPTADNRT